MCGTIGKFVGFDTKVFEHFVCCYWVVVPFLFQHFVDLVGFGVTFCFDLRTLLALGFAFRQIQANQY